MWHMGDGWGWWMVTGWIWMAVFWGLVIYGIYALTTHRNADSSVNASTEPNAMEILARRFASGELSDEQFEAMRLHLAGAPTAVKAAGVLPTAPSIN